MKKILRPVGIVLLTLIIVFLLYFIFINTFKIMANIDFSAGRYDKAADKYEIILLFEPNNEKIKYNLADSLVKLPFDYKTQTLITNFLEFYERESFAYPLREKLDKFRANLDWQIGPNYIDKVPLNNEVVRWEDDAFPLKVYIPSEPAIYSNAIKKAFEYWQYTTGNFVSFAFINTDKDADIKVQIAGNAKTNCEGDEDCAYVLALTSPNIKNNILLNMNMMVHSSDPYGRDYPPEHVYKVTLHEIGHALGIMGHSDNPNDIMYSSNQNHEDDIFAEHAKILSRRDVNTLNYLYMIVPNISNIPEDKHDTKNKIHPNVILGTSEEIMQRDIQNAKNYISKAPNLPVGYMDLGNAYLQSEYYDEALKTYQKGFEVSMNNNDKYNFIYNMAIVYLKKHDKDKALEYAEYAQKIQQTDEIQKFIHDIKTPWGLSDTKY